MKHKAKLIHPDGTTTDIEPANGESFTLEEAQKHVGGYVEIIHVKTSAGTIMLINEEGKLLGLPVNRAATECLRESGCIPGDYIAGNAILCHTSQFK